MVLVLKGLGAVAVLIGAGMAAWGGPNNPNDMGNAFIIAGTTAIIGGLILIALAEAVRQLRHIADSLLARPVGRSPHDLFEPAAQPEPASQEPAAPRIPFPPKVEPRKRAPMTVEPRLDVAPSIDSGGTPFERPAPAFARHAPEPRVIPERDEAPLSPAEPRFMAHREEKDELAEGLLATAFSRLDVSLRPTPPAADNLKSHQDKTQNEMFDSLWPPERKSAETEPIERSEEAAPAAEMPAEGPVDEQQPEQEPEAPYAVSILKSGVVDGMAYTLYSDGSIEAEMPQGTMRFASINELRAYLEKSSS